MGYKSQFLVSVSLDIKWVSVACCILSSYWVLCSHPPISHLAHFCSLCPLQCILTEGCGVGPFGQGHFLHLTSLVICPCFLYHTHVHICTSRDCPGHWCCHCPILLGQDCTKLDNLVCQFSCSLHWLSGYCSLGPHPIKDLLIFTLKLCEQPSSTVNMSCKGYCTHT